MDREDQQNSTGTQAVPGQSQATAQWLSMLDPVFNQIMESLMTSNVGTQAFSSSFALFDFIFNSFATFSDELNKNPPDETFTVKIVRPSAPSERPNPQNAFEMIRIMKGHISVGMWALILYARDGYLSVHLLPSQFLSSIVDDKMGDFPAYLEIVQPEGQTGSWQIENKPIVIEVIPGLIRHLVEHLVRVSRGEATANERFSFFSPRKTKETPSLAPVPVSEPAPNPVLTPPPPPPTPVLTPPPPPSPAPAPLPFTMPASVQAAIAGNVLPSGGPGATPTSNGGDAPAQAQSSANNQAITRSQIIKNLMQEAREKEKNASIQQEKTVAMQQFAMPGAPDLGFQNPSASNPGTSSSTSNPALPPFPAPPAGLFGSPPQGFSAPPGAPAMPSQLESSSQIPAIPNQPQAFQAPPPSPFARPGAPPPSAPPPPPGQPPRQGLPPPGFSGAPPAPPGPGFGSPPPFPGAAPAAPPPAPGLASISPPPMPAHFAPPPPPAPSAPAVPVVPFPQFTQTSMPAAQLPESLIEEVSQSSNAAPPASKSLFDDEEDSQEQEAVEPSYEEYGEPEDGALESQTQYEAEERLESESIPDSEYQTESESYSEDTVNSEVQYDDSQYDVSYQEQETENYQGEDSVNEYDQDSGSYDQEQYETDSSYQMNGQVTNGFAATIAEPLDTPEALGQIMYQSERVMRDGCNQILNELDQVLDSLRAAAQVAMHNDNIQAVTDIMHHSKQIKALRERLVVFKDENVKDE